MASIATLSSALKADVLQPAPGGRSSVLVIGIALEEAESGIERLNFVIVDHDGHGQIVPASQLTFTDDSVMPPKYG